MPAWLMAALGLLGGGLASGGGGIPGITGQGIPLLPAALDPFEPGGFSIFAPGGGKDGKRRRRKRALTNSDRDDIAFIAATIGKTAAGSFAVQLVTRSR